MSLRQLWNKLPGGTKHRAEDSIELRAWVLAAVLVGEAAVLTTGYFGAVTSVLVPFLTVVAFVVSYRRRRERNIIIKVMLAFGALAALAMFFREVSVLALRYEGAARQALPLGTGHTCLRPAGPQGPLLLAGERLDPGRRRRRPLDEPVVRPVRASLPALRHGGHDPDEPLRGPRAGRAAGVEKQGPRGRHRRALFLRRRRGRSGLLLPTAPAAGDEPDDDADIGFSRTLGRTSPAASRTLTTGRLAVTPSQAPRRLSCLTRTTAFSLTWTSAAAGGSPTRS